MSPNYRQEEIASDGDKGAADSDGIAEWHSTTKLGADEGVANRHKRLMILLESAS